MSSVVCSLTLVIHSVDVKARPTTATALRPGISHNLELTPYQLLNHRFPSAANADP
jgi:hypothetical protein